MSCPETAPVKARMQQQFPGALEDLLKAFFFFFSKDISLHSWGHTSTGWPGNKAEEKRADLWTRGRTEVHCCRDVGLNYLLSSVIHFLKLLYPMAKLSSLSDGLSSELPL